MTSLISPFLSYPDLIKELGSPDCILCQWWVDANLDALLSPDSVRWPPSLPCPLLYCTSRCRHCTYALRQTLYCGLCTYHTYDTRTHSYLCERWESVVVKGEVLDPREIDLWFGGLDNSL